MEGSHVRATRGSAATCLPPVDRRKTGSKHHSIYDRRGTSLRVITTAANINDVTQTFNLVDGILPVAGRTGRPRRRPESVVGRVSKAHVALDVAVVIRLGAVQQGQARRSV
ncbi:hypothetical protein GCM10010289_44480 [Streptomyces violascens]|uniref:Transposase n=1 Tax=Streptomyces violascens TaxID=67381 RepID=A0ABQ3QXQ0_9ACTN|nr:hypothetical protein GCM10010289_44480 [Streptomyces violascens]GHI42040.1 hypothetical protein Sviol_64480 [Streptomyces violascens]